jgi:hypothetical protein
MWTFVTFHAAWGMKMHHKLRKRGVDLMMQSSYEAQINWLSVRLISFILDAAK